jgi:hypothetical protein
MNIRNWALAVLSAVIISVVAEANQPAIVRRPDAARRYDVYLPDGNGYWTRVGLLCPQWDNANPDLCSAWNCLPIQTLTSGVVRPGKIYTKANNRLTESGNWCTLANIGYSSGFLVRYASSTNSSVTCDIPPGHDHVSVLFKQIKSPFGGNFSVYVGGNLVIDNYETSYSGTANPETANCRLDEVISSIEPSDSPQQLQLVLTSSRTPVYLISVQSWDSNGVADPREVDADGLWKGNRHIESYADCYGGLYPRFPHVPNTFTDCDRLCTPNTFDLVFAQNNGSGVGKWTGYGFHYNSVDNPFTPIILPTLSVDGSPSIEMTAVPCGGSEMQYGEVRIGDIITTSCTGTCGVGGATSVTFGQVFTENGIEMPASIMFTNSALANPVYLPTISGSDRLSTLGLPPLEFNVTIPPSPDVYVVPPANIEIPAQSITVARNDSPWVVDLSCSIPATFLAAGTNKVYLKLDRSYLPTPASGVEWNITGYASIYNSLHIEMGDLNCNGAFNLNDVGPFVMILADPSIWKENYPDCQPLNADMNADGNIDFQDINPFVEMLSSVLGN